MKYLKVFFIYVYKTNFIKFNYKNGWKNNHNWKFEIKNYSIINYFLI